MLVVTYIGDSSNQWSWKPGKWVKVEPVDASDNPVKTCLAIQVNARRVLFSISLLTAIIPVATIEEIMDIKSSIV